ncbi:MAG: hypothetical protein M0P44_06320 [Clostridiales bacterium]|nr:hypothetical protein [Clostridiales bacterium]
MQQSEKKYVPPLKAIRLNCLECVGTRVKVENCEETDCPLWHYRFGKNPFRTKRVLSEEQKKAASERFKAMWAAKKAEKEAKAKAATKTKATKTKKAK